MTRPLHGAALPYTFVATGARPCGPSLLVLGGGREFAMGARQQRFAVVAVDTSAARAGACSAPRLGARIDLEICAKTFSHVAATLSERPSRSRATRNLQWTWTLARLRRAAAQGLPTFLRLRRDSRLPGSQAFAALSQLPNRSVETSRKFSVWMWNADNFDKETVLPLLKPRRRPEHAVDTGSGLSFHARRSLQSRQS